MDPVRLLIVDDHDILRYGVRALLRQHADIQVVGEADSVADAIRQAAELVPDVVLMDARLPDGSGIDACREILSSHPSVRVLFFSAYSDKQTVFMTRVAGAPRPCIQGPGAFRRASGDPACRGGREGHRRERPRRRAEAPRPATRRPARVQAALSPQEERVIQLVVEGKTNKEIARELALSDKTVKNYLYNAFQKLGIERRGQAAGVFDLARLESKP